MRRPLVGLVGCAIIGVFGNLTSTRAEQVWIEIPAHHLGDNYINDGAFSEVPSPEGISWQSRPFDFPLAATGTTQLVLDLADVWNVNNAIRINGTFIGIPPIYDVRQWQNNQSVAFDGSLLLPTANTISITVAPDATNNYDDIMFRNIRISTVPEPSTFALLGIGALGLLGYGWRRRRKAYCVAALAAFLCLPASKARSLDFTVVALPDSQNYSAAAWGGEPAMFSAQTNWIINNASAQKIAFVTHEGDVINDPVGPRDGVLASPIQWNHATTAMFSLDNYVPWAIAPGNHDGPVGNGYPSTQDPSYTNYKANFPVSHFAAKSWFCPGSPGVGPNDVNTYSVIRGSNTQGGYRDYLMINLEYDSSNALNWAQQVINANPDRPTILTLHNYLQCDDNFAAGHSDNGSAVWNSLVNPNKQIFAVLCGHVDWGDYPDHMAANTAIDQAGCQVYEMLADYQDRSDGGGSYMRLLQFDEADNAIHVKTYSPYYDNYLTDATNQFDLSVDFNDRFGPAVPEPSTFPLLGVGTISLLAYAWRKRRTR
jgi:hypothetical protein